MDPKESSEKKEMIEIIRDVDYWYALRWDILEIKRAALFFGPKKRIVKPNFEHLNKDFQILVKGGPEVLFELVINEQGSIKSDQAGAITRILNGGNAFFELMGRRSEARMFNSDEIVQIERSIWFQKQVQEDAIKIANLHNSTNYEIPEFNRKEDEYMIELCLKRWGGQVPDKKQFEIDFDMLNYYRGRQELVRDILIKQAGYSEEKADREMNDRPFASRVVIEIMKKSKNFLNI